MIFKVGISLEKNIVFRGIKNMVESASHIIIYIKWEFLY